MCHAPVAQILGKSIAADGGSQQCSGIAQQVPCTCRTIPRFFPTETHNSTARSHMIFIPVQPCSHLLRGEWLGPFVSGILTTHDPAATLVSVPIRTANPPQQTRHSPRSPVRLPSAFAKWHWPSLSRRKTAFKASSGCRSPGNVPLSFCESRSRNAPGWYRPIDIDRSPHFTQQVPCTCSTKSRSNAGFYAPTDAQENSALHASNPRICYCAIDRFSDPNCAALRHSTESRFAATATTARTTPTNSPPRQLILLMAQGDKSRGSGAGPQHPSRDLPKICVRFSM
jgi:hypothetical protein